MVRKYTQDKLTPELVRKMDVEGSMDKSIFPALFEMGLMGIEIPEKYGGSDMNFMSTIVMVEELARKDPAVSVACDV